MKVKAIMTATLAAISVNGFASELISTEKFDHVPMPPKITSIIKLSQVDITTGATAYAYTGPANTEFTTTCTADFYIKNNMGSRIIADVSEYACIDYNNCTIIKKSYTLNPGDIVQGHNQFGTTNSMPAGKYQDESTIQVYIEQYGYISIAEGDNTVTLN